MHTTQMSCIMIDIRWQKKLDTPDNPQVMQVN